MINKIKKFGGKNLLEEALRLWSLGLKVLPVKIYWENGKLVKKPLIDWKKLMSKPQTEDDVLAMPWADGNGVETVMGEPCPADKIDEPKLYWCALDIDSGYEEKAKIIFERGVLPEETLACKTPRGGKHYHYLSTEPVATYRAKFKDILGIEVLGIGSVVVMPPSSDGQYEWIETYPPAIVEDLEEKIFEAARELGWRDPDEETGKTIQPTTLKLGFGEIWAIPCLRFFREHPFPENHRELTLGKNFCILLHGLGLTDEEIVEVAKKLAEIQPKFTYKDITSWLPWVKIKPRRLNCREIEKYMKEVYPDFTCGKCRILTLGQFTLQSVVWVEEALVSPDLLYRVKCLLDKVLIGEDENKLTLYTLGLTHKIPKSEVKQIISLKSSSGAGKTKVTGETINKIFPVVERGRFSPTALEKMAEAKKLTEEKILVLKELFGEEKSSRLRLLSADDGGYIAEVTVKVGNEFKSKEYKLPAVTIVTTTTSLELDPQFERRTWILSLDESPEQTKRIWNFKSEKEIKKLLDEPEENVHEKLKAIVECLDASLDVVLPFPEVIAECLDASKLRSRSDWDKLATLIKMVAFLHQKQRPQARGKIFATPVDLWLALTIAPKTITFTTHGIDQRIIEIIPKIFAIKQAQLEITPSNIKNVTGKSSSWCSKALKILEEKGFLTSEKIGRTRVYSIVDEEKLKKLENTLISQNKTFLCIKAKKELEKRLNDIIFQPGLEDVVKCLKECLQQEETIHPITGEKVNIYSEQYPHT